MTGPDTTDSATPPAVPPAPPTPIDLRNTREPNPFPTIPDGLIEAWRMDGQGGAQPLDWPGVESWQPTDGPLWLRLDRRGKAARRWLFEASGLDPIVAHALLAPQSRPRLETVGDGLLVLLRGVNFNPGAEPEDMVSIRIWCDGQRLVTLQRERVMAAEDVAERLRSGGGPRRTAEALTQLVVRLVERMQPIIDGLGDAMDGLEDQLLDEGIDLDRGELADLRRQIIGLRRYIAPQREAMARLGHEDFRLLTAKERAAVREATNRLTRYVEDLDAARERAAVIQDELATQQAERLNARIYVMTIVAAIFLPLSFIAGVFGMNLAGIPAAEHPWAFPVAAGGMTALGLALLILLRRWKWL